jgi:hypothetical protein
MSRQLALLLILLTLSGAYGAHAFGMGKLGINFGRSGSTAGKAIPAAPQPTGDVLMVDGTSLILQTDGASFICRAGGC